MSIESITTKEHGTIAYSLEVQQQTQKTLEATQRALETNNAYLRWNIYLIGFLMLLITATLLLLYTTNVLPTLIQWLARIRIRG